MTLLQNIALLVVGLLAVAFLLMGVLDSTRGTPIRRIRAGDGAREAPAVSDPLFQAMMELFTATPLTQGHTVEILANGDGTYPRLWADLRAARRSITMQMYYCKEGSVADTLAEILTERARAGVRVLFLYDAFGSSLSRAYRRRLRQGGVEVTSFRRIGWRSLHTAQHRSHVRVVVVDGAVGHTGGFGVDDKWLGGGRRHGEWRETNVRFTGPAVLQLQATFASCWAEATGDLLVGDLFFPLATERADGLVLAGLLHAAPTVGSTPAERFTLLSIAGARQRLYITNAYFVPDDDFRRQIREAAGRGVDVRILAASRRTDVKTAHYAGRASYTELLRAGVCIFEYQPSVLHAKTFVVDGLWSSIGSMNADNRSMAFNEESNLMVLDPALGAAMEAMFLEDLRYATEITLAEFRRRPWAGRVLEQGARLLSRVL